MRASVSLSFFSILFVKFSHSATHGELSAYSTIEDFTELAFPIPPYAAEVQLRHYLTYPELINVSHGFVVVGVGLSGSVVRYVERDGLSVGKKE